MGRDSVEEYRRKGKLPLVVVLDNIRSLNNIGVQDIGCFPCGGNPVVRDNRDPAFARDT